MTQLLGVWGVLAMLFMGCNGGQEQPASDDKAAADTPEVFQYASEMGGAWRLVSCVKGKESVLSDCDKSSVWTFSEELAEPLGDGTEVFRLLVSSLEDSCDESIYEAKWRDMRDGSAFISKAKVGGFGGLSVSGMFEILDLGAQRMELRIQDAVFTFER